MAANGGQTDPERDAPSRPVAPVDRLFVGRAREIDQITRGLDDAMAGRGRFFMLMGEPGIGKTRLCDEVTAAAARRGIPVLWGRSWEAGGAPAYWPWMDVLAGLSRQMDPGRLRSALGDGATLVVDLVPEIRDRLPPLPALAPPPPDEARFRLCRTAVGLVRSAAEPAGLVLVFDDLHSADRSSLLLLYALARELRSLRVLLIATCRDVEARLDPETGEIISRMGREGTTLALGRLDRETVNTWLRQHTTGLDPDVERRIFDSTQGNPLFLDEMLRVLGDEGPASIAAGVVPSGVRDVIRQRLDRVAGDARGLLDLAAVAGDEVQPVLLAAAAGRDPEWIAAKIIESVRAGVFAQRAGRLRFSHALVREVLYRDLPDDTRRAHHGAVGRAIERLHASDPVLPLMELAHHGLESSAADVERAVDFAVRAASRAIELTAPEEAVAVLLRALSAVEATGNPAGLRVRVLLALADTRIWRAEVAQGKALCLEAATLARSLDDPLLLARAALTYGRVFMFAMVDPVMVQLLEEALAAQPAGDSILRARLMARLAGALQPATYAEEPVRLARDAIATARRLGDRRGLLETMYDGLAALMDIVDPNERRVLNLEVESLARAAGDRERLLRTHARLALDHLALGDFSEADARIDAFEALATELQASWILWRVPLFRAVRAVTHGRFEEAEELEERARVLAKSTQDPQVERALILHREGLLRTAERYLEMRALEPRVRRERSIFHNSLVWQGIGSALTFTRLEEVDNARNQFEVVWDRVGARVDNLFALFVLAESAAFVGSPRLADEVYQQLLPFADQYSMLGMAQFQWEGPVTRLLALLAARVGRWDDAWAHFEDALGRLRRLDARPHLARTHYEFGRALLQRGRPADVAGAREHFTAACALARDLGMWGLVQRTTACLSRSEGAQEPAVTMPAPETSLPPRAAAPAADTMSLTMTLEGEYWTVNTSAGVGPTVRLKDSLGLQYLARLLAEPGREIHVLELVAGGHGAAEDAVVDAGDAGEHLDDDARADYRRRLEDLREILAEAESFGDAARASRVREEIDFLGAELGRAVGLGGRSRRAGSAAERARSAVQRRIKHAIVRISEAAPELAPWLARTVKTGNFCAYRPEPRGPH